MDPEIDCSRIWSARCTQSTDLLFTLFDTIVTRKHPQKYFQLLFFSVRHINGNKGKICKALLCFHNFPSTFKVGYFCTKNTARSETKKKWLYLATLLTLAMVSYCDHDRHMEQVISVSMHQVYFQQSSKLETGKRAQTEFLAILYLSDHGSAATQCLLCPLVHWLFLVAPFPSKIVRNKYVFIT